MPHRRLSSFPYFVFLWETYDLEGPIDYDTYKYFDFSEDTLNQFIDFNSKSMCEKPPNVVHSVGRQLSENCHTSCQLHSIFLFALSF